MPEINEIHEIINKLKSHFKNTQLLSINILDKIYLEKKSSLTLKEYEYINTLLKQSPYIIDSFNSKGKFSYIKLTSSTSSPKYFYIGLTYGLKGEILYELNDKVQISFDTDKNSFYYYDRLKFGNITLYKNNTELNKKLDSIGYDVLEITIDQFNDILFNTKNMYICDFLMNQKLISGIGNHLRTEILYSSNIHPLSKTHSLQKIHINKLFNNIKLFSSKSSSKINNNIYDKKIDINNNTIHILKINNRKIYYTDSQELL